MSTNSFNAYWMFEDHFAKTLPGAACVEITVKFITADNELAAVTITREGFVERLEEFEDDEDQGRQEDEL
jgi:hypothetical protein